MNFDHEYARSLLRKETAPAFVKQRLYGHNLWNKYDLDKMKYIKYTMWSMEQITESRSWADAIFSRGKRT